MLYKVIEISTDKVSKHTYVLVHFWRDKAAFDAGKPPDHINDFLMQLRPTGVRVVVDAEGRRKTKDGRFTDPETLDPDKPQPEWARETYDRDLPTQIENNIKAYWQRAESNNFPADHTDFRIQRDDSDPYRVLTRADVLALKDSTVEKL